MTLDSPDGTYVAELVTVSGGGAAGFMEYEVRIRKLGEDDPPKRVWAGGRVVPQRIRWISESRLSVLVTDEWRDRLDRIKIWEHAVEVSTQVLEQ